MVRVYNLINTYLSLLPATASLFSRSEVKSAAALGSMAINVFKLTWGA